MFYSSIQQQFLVLCTYHVVSHRRRGTGGLDANFECELVENGDVCLLYCCYTNSMRRQFDRIFALDVASFE